MSPMKGHIAPHRWAELELGKVTPAERARMDQHAASCSRCARARDRITASRASFPTIASAPGPELRWDHIGARIYWSVSSERRAKERTGETLALPRQRPARRWWIAAPVAAALAAASWFGYARLTADEPRHAAPAIAVTPDREPVPVELVEIPPAPLTGVVTLAQGAVDIDGVTATTELFDHAVVARSVIHTAAGRASIQFGDGSAFAVGPETTLTVRRFDATGVELVVDGEVAVEVTHRAANQRFAVLAGDRVVEVRGTAFRVERQDGRTTVSCQHGVVAVSTAETSVDVVGGRWLSVADGEPLLAQAVTPLDATRLNALMTAAPHQLPAWADASALGHTTRPLSVAARVGRSVRVDGEVVGAGPLALRVMSGRHLVEAERAPGRWAPGEWVDAQETRIEPGHAIDQAKTAVEAAPPTSRAAITARRHQLRAGLDRDQLRGCVRALEKQGFVAGSYIVLELGVDASGAVQWLNVGDTNLPTAAAACVRDVAAQVSFPRGGTASLTERVEF
jgi:hypothetical protein